MKNKLVLLTLLLPTMLILSFCRNEHSIEKRIVSTKESPAAIGPYSQGIIAGEFLFTSGQLPIHPVTGEVPATIEEQTKQVLNNLKSIIEAAGSNMENVVKCTVYLQNMDDFAVMNKVYSTYFTVNQPARATIEVSKMAKNALIEIDAIAIIEK